jgi:Flp pilus assembly pilin Flp
MRERMLLLSVRLNGFVRRVLTAKISSAREDTGASIVEYALLVALVGVVAAGALIFLGNTVHDTLNHVSNQINSTNNVTP